MKRLSLRLRFFAFSLVFLVISGCSFPNDIAENGENQEQEKTYAVQEEGVVSPLEMTTGNEPGTHLLVTRSGKKYILRSQIVDLSDYEDFLVTVTGEMTEGEEDSVITVFAVDVKQSRPELRQSVFTEPDFGISFSLPGNWQRSKVSDEKIEFFPEGTDPVITLERVPMRTKEGIALQEKMITGTPVLVAEKSAKRLVESGGRVDIFVTLTEKASILVFSLTPQQNPSEERSVFYALLSEATWISENTEIPSLDLSEEDTGIRCGGRAKILCPSGYRCELESTEPDSTGVCVDANLAPSVVTKVLSRSPETIPNATPPETSDSSSSFSKTEAIPTGWLRYNRDAFRFSFAIPRSWWWRGTTPEEGILARTEISPEEVTSENWVIRIDVLPESVATAHQEIRSGLLSFSLPRDSESHFVVSGKMEYAEIVKGVVSSLSLFPSL